MSEHDREVRTRTRRMEREEFERGHREPGTPPPTPRPAATMVLARPADTGFEILLLKRPEAAAFAAGAWVFAGGREDPEDGDSRLLSRLRGITGDGHLRALAAAVREQFEETGLLVGAPGVEAERLRESRRALLDGRRSFPAIVEGLGGDFGELETAHFARWITPPELARRYDARFFLARHTGGELELLEELVEARWATAAAALEGFEAGELPMLFPTRKTLERLASYGSLEDALDALGRRPVETFRPRLLVSDGGVVPVLPGDPGYEAAAGGERHGG